jgi:hypothetical protein
MELSSYDKEKQGQVWFGDRYARQFTQTLNADEKGVFYNEIAKSGLAMHDHHDPNKLQETCQNAWRVAAWGKKNPQ